MVGEGAAEFGCELIDCDSSLEPQELKDRNNFHYGEGCGPDQLQNMYTDTEFGFKGRGEKGPDVEVLGGKDPWDYEDSDWIEGNKYGDFKPNTEYSEERFNREIKSGKLPQNTQPLPYDKIERMLSKSHKFTY